MTTTIFFPQLTPNALASTNKAFQRLLSKRRLVAPETSIAPMDRFMAMLGIQNVDAVPWAVLLARQEGLAIDGHAIWLEPVHLTIHRDTLVLDGACALPTEILTALAQELALSVNHLDWTVSATQKGQFVIHSPLPLSVVTQPWWRVWGQDIRGFLPRGEAAPQWLRLFNEWQMAVHLALRATSNGQESPSHANALWPWGGGAFYPPSPMDRSPIVYCDALHTQCLVEWMGMACKPLTQCLTEPAAGGLVVVGECLPEGDSMEACPTDFIEKIADYAERNQAVIVFADGTQAQGRTRSWAFWRK